jgi:4-diphosphocytidyl-2-C-methyl-D-erythritol kinase
LTEQDGKVFRKRHADGDNPAMRALTVPAPAKVNLFLHVTGRRSDGRHQLETLFVALDFGDTLHIARRDDGAIRRVAGWQDVAEEDDLALRAARALKSASGCAAGVDITVTKRIPVGGGLGGGSSDAASVLLALNRLWDLGLPRSRLMEIALTLGADVPFFVLGEPAFACGVGEILRRATSPPMWIALIAPDVHVSTGAIFASPQLTRDTPSAKMDVFSEGYGRNDLEEVAAACHPEIGAALAELRRHSQHARMTGSGSTVFASFASGELARDAIRCTPPGMRSFIARTLSRHPLAAFA